MNAVDTADHLPRPPAGEEPPAPRSPLSCGFSIQDAARLTGVPAHTLRWYERVGLVPDVARCATGRRRFSEANLAWVAVLRALRATGMPVATLRLLTEHHRTGDRAAGVRLVHRHRTQVLAVIMGLQRSLLVLDAVEEHLRGSRSW